MSKKAAKHHRKASEHHTYAARHHAEAAKHHEAGLDEKAARHAHTAEAHMIYAKGHAEEAAKSHAEKFRQEVKEFWAKMDRRENKDVAAGTATPANSPDMTKKRHEGAAKPKKKKA
jgi:hypothetical protein